jgi:hypothetical protein
MEPEVTARFDEVWAVLREVAARQEAAELRTLKAEQRMDQLDRKWEQRMAQLDRKWEQRMDRTDQRMDRAEQRMERADQKWEQRMELAEQRVAKADERWDKRFESTRKLVETGIGIVNRIGRRQGELERAHKAFLESFRKGTNGRKRG